MHATLLYRFTKSADEMQRTQVPWHSTPRDLSFLLLAAFLGLSLVLQPAVARADFLQWLSGLVTESDDVEVATRGEMSLPPGAITTGPTEVRTLTLGRDVLELYPSTAITIDKRGEKTTINLLDGTVRSKVGKRKKMGLFEVRTLLMVATVKGTVFEVSTADDVSAVSVYEGRVAVKAINGVGGVDITPGKTATVSARDHGAKVGDTPDGGAVAAAKKASSASASSAKAHKPIKAAAAPAAAPVQTAPPAPGSADIDDDRKNKKDEDKEKKEKGDKKGKKHH